MKRNKKPVQPPKFDQNWLQLSLNSLEKNTWPQPDGESYLMVTCFQLRSKPIGSFSIEDLRIMIGQDIGLPFLIPLALDILETNILAEGDYYGGDLLNAVLTSDFNFWRANHHYWKQCCAMLEQQKEQLLDADTTKDIRNSWKSNMAAFIKMHD